MTSPTPADPLDDARALIGAAALPPPDPEAPSAEGAGALGELAAWRASWPGPAAGERRVLRPILSIYVAAYATDAGASERARARLEHLAAGGEGLGAMAQSLGCGLDVFDLGLERPSPAPGESEMRPREAAATLAFGMEALAKSPDVLVLGSAVEGGDAAARALLGALHVQPGAEGFDLMRRLAGREVAAMVGALVAARQTRTPVLLDGPGAVAAAAVLRRVGGRIAVAHARDAREVAKLGVDVSTPGVAGLAALALLRLAGEHAHALTLTRASPLPSGRPPAHPLAD